MTLESLQPRVALISVPTPYKVGPVNVYLVDGEPLTLVDVGPRTEAAWDALCSGVEQLGYAFPDIEQIVLTHAHLDHFGQLSPVVDATGAPVYAHPRARVWLTDTEAEWERRATYFAEFWERSGVPAERVTRMRRAHLAGAQQTRALSPSAVVRDIDEGDEICLGGAMWKVLYMPGHSSSQICLYEPRSRQLIAGDHLLLRISSNPLLEPPVGNMPRSRSLVEYIASLKRVAAMDIAVAWTGHGAPVYDHRGLVAQRLEHLRLRSEHIAGLLAERPMTPYELSQHLFPDLPTSELFLGISEVVGHLDVLAADRRVQETHANSVVRFKIT